MEEVSLQLIRNVLQENHAVAVAQSEHWQLTRTHFREIPSTRNTMSLSVSLNNDDVQPHINHPHDLWISSHSPHQFHVFGCLDFIPWAMPLAYPRASI